mmetsp:Transcript_84817/g.150189  ORF Transcript_84817/g.150189 Transcript_84817/m.150189 type:complete len:135 (+) Transcript_84817:101-505(+)
MASSLKLGSLLLLIFCFQVHCDLAPECDEADDGCADDDVSMLASTRKYKKPAQPAGKKPIDEQRSAPTHTGDQERPKLRRGEIIENLTVAIDGVEVTTDKPIRHIATEVGDDIEALGEHLEGVMFGKDKPDDAL